MTFFLMTRKWKEFGWRKWLGGVEFTQEFREGAIEAAAGRMHLCIQFVQMPSKRLQQGSEAVIPRRVFCRALDLVADEEEMRKQIEFDR